MTGFFQPPTTFGPQKNPWKNEGLSPKHIDILAIGYSSRNEDSGGFPHVACSSSGFLSTLFFPSNASKIKTETKMTFYWALIHCLNSIC